MSILTGKSEDDAYKDSDVDLFLFGLQPDEVGLTLECLTFYVVAR